MSEFTPHLAPLVILLFLSTVFLAAVSILVLLYGLLRRSFSFAKIGVVCLIAVLASYTFLLCGVSLASREKVLPPGGRKYFCEVDCHIAYSIVGAHTEKAFGPELQQTMAKGQFVVVRLKAWFDEGTISPHRGDAPLMTDSVRIVLIDDRARSFARSIEAEDVLAKLRKSNHSLVQALRPGDSFTTDLVFDVPTDSHGLRLLVMPNDPVFSLVVDSEDSPLHKKIYLALE